MDDYRTDLSYLVDCACTMTAPSVDDYAAWLAMVDAGLIARLPQAPVSHPGWNAVDTSVMEHVS